MGIIGSAITKEEKKIFQRIINTQDLMDISESVDVSLSTVKNVYYRNVTVTKDNELAYLAIKSKAFEKIEEALYFFEKAKSDLLATMPIINKN